MQRNRVLSLLVLLLLVAARPARADKVVTTAPDGRTRTETTALAGGLEVQRITFFAPAGEKTGADTIRTWTLKTGTRVSRRERFDATGKLLATFVSKSWRLKNGQEIRHTTQFDARGIKTMSNRFVPDPKGGYKERTIRYTPEGKVLKVSRAWRANNTGFLSLVERGPGWTTSYRSADGPRTETVRVRERSGDLVKRTTRELPTSFLVSETRRTRDGKVTRRTNTVPKPRGRTGR